jgi:hypothetical protein
MISTPRCGEPVEYYELRRPRDEMDVVSRRPDQQCFRPKGHAEHERKAGRAVRHASEASVRRTMAQAMRRKRAWRKARRAENVGAR